MRLLLYYLTVERVMDLRLGNATHLVVEILRLSEGSIPLPGWKFAVRTGPDPGSERGTQAVLARKPVAWRASLYGLVRGPNLGIETWERSFGYPS